jgi:hypothetical protein
MTNPTFRALCAELVDIATAHCNPDDYAVGYCAAVLARARAALAQPEPVAPTDQELLKLAAKAFGYAFVDGEIGWGESEFLAFARAIEDRLLKHRPYAAAGTTRQGIAAASAQPVPVAPMDEELTDQEIEEWADAAAEVPAEELDQEVHGWRRCFTSEEFRETIRAALARWGTPTNTTREEN